MRSFSQNPKTTQPTTSASRTTARQAHIGQGQDSGSILNLQRKTGDQALLRMLRSNAEEQSPVLAGTVKPCFGHDFDRIPVSHRKAGSIQTKLSINKQDDMYEQEADRIADRVMRMSDPFPLVVAVQTVSSAGSKDVQRLCTMCGEDKQKQVRRQAKSEQTGSEEGEITQEHETRSTALFPADLKLSDEPVIVHRACATCGANKEEQNRLTREGERGDYTPEDAATVVGKLLRASSGQPLDPSARSFMEQRFGVDFSPVRVHAGAEAAVSAHSLGAHAYTVGQHVVFGAGRYQPATNEGKRLLAHELTHVIQQSGTSAGITLQEMTPGYYSSHQARPTQALAQPAVQRDKIDHRQLAWDDFQGKAPKASKYWASTASGFNPPDLKALIPKKLEAQDTGEACVVKKKKTGDVMGTTFRVDIGLDGGQVAVTPYMWQEKSWRMPWTTDADARTTKCKAEVVKKCQQSFTKQLKQVDKECKKSQKDCKKAFKAGDIPSWSITIEDEEVAAANVQECTDVILERCRELKAGTLYHSHSMAGVTITAYTKKECEEEFQQACVDELLELASSNLLQHEQGHFDITNVRAEQTQDALRALVEGFDCEVTVCAKGDTDKGQKTGKTKAIAKAKTVLAKELKQLQKEYAKGQKGLTATQKQYDSATQHGVVEAMQQMWQEQIGEGLP